MTDEFIDSLFETPEVKHDFAESYHNERTDDNTKNILDNFYRHNMPFKYFSHMHMHRIDFAKQPHLQKCGVDIQLTFDYVEKINVEEKIRYEHYEDILLEKWSVLEKQTVGWTLDDRKTSDWLVYINNYIYVFDYKKLRKLYKDNILVWEKKYREIPVKNRNYTTVNLAVPISELKEALLYTDGIKYRNIELENRKKLQQKYEELQ